jgi:hypothetical protein
MYVCGDQRRWIGDNQYGRRRYLTACVQAHVERPLIFDIHERNPFEIQILGFLMAIRETEFSSDTIPLTGYAGWVQSLFCLHGKKSWTRNLATATFASSGERVTGFHEASVDGSKIFGFFSKLDAASGTCFMVGIIAHHKSSAEWNRLHLLVQQTDYSATIIPGRKSPGSSGMVSGVKPDSDIGRGLLFPSRARVERWTKRSRDTAPPSEHGV